MGRMFPIRNAGPFGASLLLVALLLAIGGDTARAQVPLRTFGVKVARVGSMVETDPDGTEPYRSTQYGFSGHVFAEWFGKSFFSVVTEVGYVQRGYQETQTYAVLRADNNPAPPFAPEVNQQDSKLDYLSGGVLFKLRHSGYRNAVAYIQAGPRLEVLVRREPGMLTYQGGDLPSPLAEHFDSWLAGGTLGVGLELNKVFPLPLLIAADYDYDLTNSLSGEALYVAGYDGWQPEPERVSARNVAFRLSVGLMF